MNARLFSGLVLLPLVVQSLGCDLAEPTDRRYNDAAHPPEVGQLQTVGLPEGEGLAGEVFITVDPALGSPQAGTLTIAIDGDPVTGAWVSDRLIGFDTRAYPDGPHTLTVGLMKPGGSPRETGLLGYLGVPDLFLTGVVVLRQTALLYLPAKPFVPWDNDLRQRPAVDGARGVLYVMETDTVKAFSTSTNTLLRSRRLTGTSYNSVTALRHLALSADGTRLYVYAHLELSGCLLALNALTLDSLAIAQVPFPVFDMACSDADRLFVSSAPPYAPSGAQGVLRALNTTILTQISELSLPLTAPMIMAISADRKTIFLASAGVCRVSVENGTPVLQSQKITGPVVSMGLSPDASRLYLAWNRTPGNSSSPSAGVTIRNAITFDSTGTVELGPSTTNVWDIVPAGQDLYAAISIWTGSMPQRVARFRNLVAMTASWDLGLYDRLTPIQASGDGRFLYAGGGAICIPIP